MEDYTAKQKILNKSIFKTIISNNKELQGEWQDGFLEFIGDNMLYGGNNMVLRNI